jgi:hypothetical protein
MHRSGTSCLTGVLQEAGLHLGDCHTWNPFNLKGNRENQDFVDLNDAVLADNGGSWDKPPGKVVWSAERKHRAAELLSGYESINVMGFKDPRTLLALDGWKDIAPTLEFVGIFRHPNAVAESLKRRSQMERKRALDLWYTYNRVLLKQYQQQPFPILCFDAGEDVFRAKLNMAIERMALTRPDGELEFYDSELKQYDNHAAPRLPWKVSRLYGRLCESSI